MSTSKTTDVATANESKGFLAAKADLASVFASELDGLLPGFDRIKVPAGGGLAFEVPGDDPDSPDLAKEIRAVILYHHPVHSFYKTPYTGGNAAPDCGSLDGHTGIDAGSGEALDCASCPHNKFGSGENGAKACKQKRRLYILREDEVLPTILSMPTGSLSDFAKYVMRLLSKGMRSSAVVTRFTLKKAQNAGGISYSQAVCTAERALTYEEQTVIDGLSAQVKRLAGRIAVTESETDAE
jgi:hypothetical protein